MVRPGDMNQWAKLGAAARLKELQEEIAAIFKAFPELRRGGSGASSSSPRGKRTRQFSAAGKAAISEGMRKYWARRKAAAKSAAKAAGK
jgi:hypothetical protein